MRCLGSVPRDTTPLASFVTTMADPLFPNHQQRQEHGHCGNDDPCESAGQDFSNDSSDMRVQETTHECRPATRARALRKQRAILFLHASLRNYTRVLSSNKSTDSAETTSKCESAGQDFSNDSSAIRARFESL